MIEADRQDVIRQFKSAEHENNKAFVNENHERHIMATSEYIYETQKQDASEIVELFHDNQGGEGMGNPCRVISVKKHVKLGADGVILDLIRQMCSYPDDSLIIPQDNVRIITGMSNKSWENELVSKAPQFLKQRIFHHRKLGKAKLEDMKDGLIIIDEIDTASKVKQVLHGVLTDAGLFEWKNLVERNIYIVVISATMAKVLCELTGWGQAHQQYTMTVPDSYAGIQYFLDSGIAKESYDLRNPKNIVKWLKEDVLSFGSDYRVHLVRLPNTNKQSKESPQKNIEYCCKKLKISFGMFSGDNPTKDKFWHTAFETIRDRHIVIALKSGGLLSRASRIAESHKLRIGAVHVSPSKISDNNAIAQDLVGRMSGHWREILESGHRVGPIRSPLKALKQYIKDYNGLETEYQCSGFKRDNKGNITKLNPSMLDVKNMNGLEGDDVKQIEKVQRSNKDDFEYKLFDSDEEAIRWVKEKHKKTMRKSGKAPKELLQNGNNPSYSYIISRQWGLNVKTNNLIRKVRTDTDKFCVYWRPSFFL